MVVACVRKVHFVCLSSVLSEFRRFADEDADLDEQCIDLFNAAAITLPANIPPRLRLFLPHASQ